MIIKDNEIVKKMAALAVNASVPVGMGFIHYKEKEYVPSDFNKVFLGDFFSIDYWEGRMVKMHLRKKDGGWEPINENLSSDYQSWCGKYTTYDDLYKAATNL